MTGPDVSRGGRSASPRPHGGRGGRRPALAARLGLRAQVGRFPGGHVEPLGIGRPPAGQPERQAAAPLLPGIAARIGATAAGHGGRRGSGDDQQRDRRPRRRRDVADGGARAPGPERQAGLRRAAEPHPPRREPGAPPGPGDSRPAGPVRSARRRRPRPAGAAAARAAAASGGTGRSARSRARRGGDPGRRAGDQARRSPVGAPRPLGRRRGRRAARPVFLPGVAPLPSDAGR